MHTCTNENSCLKVAGLELQAGFESTKLATEFYLGKLNENLLVSLIVNLVKKKKMMVSRLYIESFVIFVLFFFVHYFNL